MIMLDKYFREFLRVAVAQVCLTIGYHVIQTTPLELLQDTLHKFLHEFSRHLKRLVEHYNRTEANLDDTYITLSNLNININDFLDYINSIEPSPLAINLSKFPVPKTTNLNFLKPGSTEVLIRPVHIYEYLPPMLTKVPYLLQSDSSTLKSVSSSLPIQISTSTERYQPFCGNSMEVSTVSTKRLLESYTGTELSTVGIKTPISCTVIFDDEGRPTREISSVVMTTGGFISPAIEGKLADTLIPKFVEKLIGLDALPPSTPQTTIVGTNRAKEHKSYSKSATSKENISGPAIDCPMQSARVSPIKTQLLKSDRQSVLLPSKSKESIMNENVAVSDVMNSIVSPKSVQSHLTHHVAQVPMFASKLLKKAKKKNGNNLQVPSTGMLSRPEQYNSEGTLDPCGTTVIGKIQGKNKNFLQNMFETGTESLAMSTDYSNAIFQRLKIEKFLKKESKYQKKLLHRQKKINDLKNNPSTNINAISENKLPLPISDPKITEDVPLKEQSIYACVPNDTGLSKQNFTQTTLPNVTPQSIIKDNISNDTIVGVGLGNTQMPAIVTTFNDKKSLPGAKLSAELDRNKLNIFKKISKQKAQKSPNINHMTSAPICSSDDCQLINLPCGTTITPTPTTLNRLISDEESSVSTELTKKSLNTSINCDLSGPVDLVGNAYNNSFSPGAIKTNVLNNITCQIEGPKKRGRKPGSKNLSKPAIGPYNSGDMAHLTKVEKYKNSKYDYPYPLLLDNPNFAPNKMHSWNATNHFIANISHGEDMGTSIFAANMKDSRKERKKAKSKNLLLNMPTELKVFKTDAEAPSKDEVITINKKLMRMDTVLQPLGTFNQKPIDTDIDIGKLHIQKSSPSTSKKEPSARGCLLPQPSSNLMPVLHSSIFSPPPGLSKMPDLLKFCHFPPGPGLIPPTAQNLLFPRLRPSFPLPLPNFKSYGVVKPINTEASRNGNDLDQFLPQLSGKRKYCNVPPFVPESMKLSQLVPMSEVQKAERDCSRTSKLHQSNTGEKISKKPHSWDSHENICKMISTARERLSFKTYELHLHNEVPIKSPSATAENRTLPGGVYSQNISPNKTSVKSSIVAPMLNSDDPIELSDDSIECPSTIVLDMLPSINHKEKQLQLSSTPVISPQMEDYMSICSDPTKPSVHTDLYLSSRGQKKSKKANKLMKTSKKKVPFRTDNLSQLDMFNTEKDRVGKLAGGADLIPLISTGLAYSSKTIPSTSLTATVASSFTLSKTDIYPTNALGNPLSSTNIEGNKILPLNMELQTKKKDHKRVKRLKDDKVKKKKDKKSKNKERLDHPDKGLHRSEKVNKDKPKETLQCDEEKHQMKDLLKKLKKEKKKKYKQLLKDSSEQANMTKVMDSIGMGGVTKTATTIFSMGGTLQNLPPPNTTSSTQSFVPKLTLKLSTSKSPTPVDDIVQKHSCYVTSAATNEFGRKKEPSPELARISPLITRPLKPKLGVAETITSSMNINQSASAVGSNTIDSVAENDVNAVITPTNSSMHLIDPPSSPWSSGGTISASSVLLPQQLLQSSKTQDHLKQSKKTDGGLMANTATASRPLHSTDRQSQVPLISETSRPSSYIDAEGNRVWICPACGKVDDGSPMIGCDGCDAWYHWICVGISVAPKDNEDWFCRVCIIRKRGVHAADKKRKRNKKK